MNEAKDRRIVCKNAPQIRIGCCAGSLLDAALSRLFSFLVGKVSFMQIDPMTFTEFLLTNGDGILAAYHERVNDLESLLDSFL